MWVLDVTVLFQRTLYDPNNIGSYGPSNLANQINWLLCRQRLSRVFSFLSSFLACHIDGGAQRMLGSLN